MGAAVDARPYETVDVGDLASLRVAVLESPFLSVLINVMDALDTGHSLLPPGTGADVRTSLGQRSRAAFEVIRSSELAAIPDLAVPPFATGRPLTMSQSLEVLRGVPPEVAEQQFEDGFGRVAGRSLRPVLAQPHFWFHALADAVDEGRGPLVDVLERQAALAAARTEQLCAAVLRGQLEVAMSMLGSRLSFDGQKLRYRHALGRDLSLDGRTLVLAPMIAPVDMLITNFEQPDAVYVAFPVASPSLPTHREPAMDRLSVLLGPRAATLLRYLERATTMGQIAVRLEIAASTATRICDELERIGFVQRRRDGRTVVVIRTDRARRLIELMAD